MSAARRQLTAQCDRCGEGVTFMDGAEGEKRLGTSGWRCECGGRYHRGRFMARPTPMELYGVLVSLAEAETEEEVAHKEHGTGSALWEEAARRKVMAAREWERLRAIVTASTRINLELKRAL